MPISVVIQRCFRSARVKIGLGALGWSRIFLSLVCCKRDTTAYN